MLGSPSSAWQRMWTPQRRPSAARSSSAAGSSCVWRRKSCARSRRTRPRWMPITCPWFRWIRPHPAGRPPAVHRPGWRKPSLESQRSRPQTVAMGIFGKTAVMPGRENALPGRSEPIRISGRHFVTGHRIAPPFPAGTQLGLFGLGCFWGAERKFWQTDGVYATAVGYAGGFTPNPTYEEVCTGKTGHNEVVRVIFDPKDIDYL